jgi:AhpD family alkylhydroperoxidase
VADVLRNFRLGSDYVEATMSTDAKTFYGEWSSRMSHAKASTPDVAKGFGGLYQIAMKPGAMSARDKELVAIGIAIALRCEACIYAHVEKAIKAGATRQQIVETAGVAVMMQGGPAYVYLPQVVEALDALVSGETAAAAGAQSTG